MKEKKGIHYVVIALTLIVLLLPVVVTMIYSISDFWIDILPGGFGNLAYWKRLFFDSPKFWVDLGRSLIISIVPVLISCVCVIMLMYSAVLYFPKIDRIAQSISMLPYTVRGVILAISVIGLYAGGKLILSNRIVMAMMVYTVMVLPYTYRGIRNNLYAINVRQIIEAAELLGAGGLYTFFRIIVPSILSGIMVSCLLGMGAIYTDFVIVNLIAGSRFETVQMYLFTSQKFEDGSYTSTIVLMMFAITFAIATVAYVLQIRASEKNKRQVTEN